MDQIPLEDILDFEKQPFGGTYEVEPPKSVCFGIATVGGLLIAIAHKAGQLFVAKNLERSNHPHLLHSNVHFFRPVQGSPKKARISIKLANLSRIWTTLHVEILQDSKVCMCGYLTFTNFDAPGSISVPTGWKLLPAPFPANIESLAADTDPKWVSYTTPIAKNSFRNAQAYLKYYLHLDHNNPNFLDQWVTPGWTDNKRADGAVWTNELIHYVLDIDIPFWLTYLPPDVATYFRHQYVLAAGLEQRRARQEGREDQIFGDRCGPGDSIPVINSSVFFSTEVKKLLPKEGSKWLFLRSFSTKLDSNRLDKQIYLMDIHGDIVAVAHHHSHLIPTSQRTIDKKNNKL